MEQAEFTKDQFQHKCFNCSSTDNLHIDHHRPLSAGYPLTIDNAVILCGSCNISKYNKMPQDWYSEDKLVELMLKLAVNNIRWRIENEKEMHKM